MAERRMFAKTIIDSDAFLDMSVTARLLYYDLGMRADDDGFVNCPKKIMRIIGASEDDMRMLVARKFIIPFESGVVVIKHWKINNTVRKDLYKETKYKSEKSMLELDENNAYSVTVTESLRSRDELVTESDTQVRLGEVRLDKVSIGECEGTPTYEALCSQYGSEFVAKRAERAKNYKGTDNLVTIAKWCAEDAKKGKKAKDNYIKTDYDFEELERLAVNKK